MNIIYMETRYWIYDTELKLIAVVYGSDMLSYDPGTYVISKFNLEVI